MQRNFLFLAVCAAPKRAPDALVARIVSPAQAIAVSLSGKKASSVARSLRISAPYLSQLANGRRQVPDWFVMPFCVLTGSLLLAQYLDLQSALRDAKRETSPRELTRRLAAELREQAA